MTLTQADIEVFLDGALIYKGILRQAPKGASEAAAKGFAQAILFTDEPAVLSSCRPQVRPPPRRSCLYASSRVAAFSRSHPSRFSVHRSPQVFVHGLADQNVGLTNHGKVVVSPCQPAPFFTPPSAVVFLPRSSHATKTHSSKRPAQGAEKV